MLGLEKAQALKVFIFAILIGILTHSIRADTPANCTFEDVQGTWNFYETERNGDRTIDCLNNSKFFFFFTFLVVCIWYLIQFALFFCCSA
jgi:cathepsin C